MIRRSIVFVFSLLFLCGLVHAGTITASGSGNWSAGGTWNGGVKPGASDVGDANGYNVTLDEDITVQGIQATTGTFVLPAGTRTITGNVTYNGTSGAGMIALTTGQTLVVNGTVGLTTAGYCISASGSAAMTINNVGATALSCTGTGWRTIYWNTGGGGSLTINGNVVCTSADGRALWSYGGTTTITGNVTCTQTVSQGVISAWAGTVININGNLVGPGCAALVTAGTITWTSAAARTIAAGESALVIVSGGTFSMNNVVLNNSGAFLVQKTGGTLTCSGASVRNVTPSAQAADTSHTIDSIITPKGRWRPRRAA